MGVDLKAAGQISLGRLNRDAVGEDPAPAQRVDHVVGSDVAAIRVHRVAGAAIDLGGLELGVILGGE